MKGGSVKLGYIFYYLLLAAGASVFSYLLPSGEILDGPSFSENEEQARAVIDLISELQQFVGALNSAMLAGCGAVVLKSHADPAVWGRFEQYSITTAIVAAGVSYFGLYASRITMIEMVVHGVIDVQNGRLQMLLALQFWSFIAGIFLLGLIFIRLTAQRNN